jgi:phenylacetic acid degradation operon negative regulatory protein
MRKKEVKKLVLKITEGVLERVVDLVLFGIYYAKEMGPFTRGDLNQKFSRIARDFDRFDYQTLKQALYRAQEKGWLSNKLEVTLKGQRRLEQVLPKYEKKTKWNGKWYLVAYDIPEEKKYLREILRKKLEDLGFGRLHKSFYICPFNFLGDVEEIVKKYDMESYVLLAVSDKLGREPSKILAERVWRLRELNDEYTKYIKEVKSGKLTKQQAIFKYLMILNRDPQLPKELLPEDWKGEEAYKIYREQGFWKRIRKVFGKE